MDVFACRLWVISKERYYVKSGRVGIVLKLITCQLLINFCYIRMSIFEHEKGLKDKLAIHIRWENVGQV